MRRTRQSAKRNRVDGKKIIILNSFIVDRHNAMTRRGNDIHEAYKSESKIKAKKALAITNVQKLEKIK